MAESPDSLLERLRSEIDPVKRNECIFAELISRSDRMPLSVAVFADDLAIKDLERRNLKVEDILTGCENIYRINGLDFSYDKSALPPAPCRWVHSPIFPEYLCLGRSEISGACIFEGQDIFLQSKASTAIFLTGHIRVGNGRVNDIRSDLHGRGVMVVGTGDYDFWNDIKSQWRAIVADAGAVVVILASVRFFTDYKALNESFFSWVFIASFLIIGAHFFSRWFEFRMTDFGYNYYLFSTAAHEQGHLFGIEHSEDEDSLMFPYGSKTRFFDPVSKDALLKFLRPLE